jgi:hypothetical protein
MSLGLGSLIGHVAATAGVSPETADFPFSGAVDADAMLYPGSRLELVPDDFKDANHLQHLGAHLVRGSWLAGVLQS